MKISLNWLRKYVDIKVSNTELISLIGARLVEVEGVIDETHKYDKIFVVRVETAEKIPDTHLTMCKIDNGTGELVDVVCGAPNVRAGMLAVWIAPGAIVPASAKEDAPFVIGKRKMLGKYESNGMLAAADELDFGDDHEGIVEINPKDAKAGDSLAEVFDLNDLILEIENKSLTHRPDCFGLIGFAREVFGILKAETNFEKESLDEKESFKYDLVSNEIIEEDFRKANEELEIEIVDENICERYTGVVFEKHGEIKKKYLTWMDTVLAKAGMRPIDPIVDATNYLMLLTGQPLHAFDYDKFVEAGKKKEAKIVVRLARAGEKMTLLNDKEIELCESDIVICSNDTPVALAGAMGGKATAIDEKTRKIILESATFSLYNLRKTQMAHGIFSEAITRFTKGQPPYQTLDVAKMGAEMLRDGFRVSNVTDKYPAKKKSKKILVTLEAINKLLGVNYSEDYVILVLTAVNFQVEKTKGGLEVEAPEWRTDISIEEDVIEEVGRITGYDNILPTLPKHGTAGTNRMWNLKTSVREIMSEFGANEVLTYSFVSGRLLEKANLETKNSYKIVNSISPELQYVRQSIVPSLLDKAFLNQKIPFDKFALFEMNKVYRKDWGMDEENVPVEKTQLGFVLAERKTSGIAYYRAKKFVEELLKRFGINAEFEKIDECREAETLPFEEKRTAKILVDGEYLGVIGEFKNSVRHEFKLAEFLAGFEINLDLLLEKANRKKVFGNFEIREKIDETITTNKTYAEVLKEIKEKYPEAKISPVSIYQPEGVTTKNITFHIEI